MVLRLSTLLGPFNNFIYACFVVNIKELCGLHNIICHSVCICGPFLVRARYNSTPGNWKIKLSLCRSVKFDNL